MGVLFADGAVGRPARVADAGRCWRYERRRLRAAARTPSPAVSGSRKCRLEPIKVSHRPHRADLVAFDQRDTCAVIAAIFEFAQSGKQNLLCRPGADVANDAAHLLREYPSTHAAGVVSARRVD